MPDNNNSEIHVHASGAIAFVGPDATRLMMAMHLASALKLYDRTKIIPTRGVTITKMMATATTLTGKPYKRGQALKAAEDVKGWADTMKAALPITHVGDEK